MRLFVVSNRLLVAVKSNNGQISLEKSSGGVAIGSAYFLEAKAQQDPEFSYYWFGWPGVAVGEYQQEKLQNELAKECLFPVFKSKKRKVFTTDFAITPCASFSLFRFIRFIQQWAMAGLCGSKLAFAGPRFYRACG